MRRAAVAWLGSGVLAGTLLGARLQDTHWLDLRGADWRSMAPDVRTAWVQGFLAGHAVGRQPDSLAGDTTALAAALDRGRRGGGFTFPYSAGLYATRLGDYYVWENHRAHPLWRAMLDVNAELGRGR